MICSGVYFLLAGKHLLDVAIECRVDRHYILEPAMDWTLLNHEDHAIALNDGGFCHRVGILEQAVELHLPILGDDLRLVDRRRHDRLARLPSSASLARVNS